MLEDKKTEEAPLLLSVILCERVMVDVRTGRKTIRDIIETINVAKYPVLVQSWVLYFELTDLHRDTTISVEVVDVRENNKVLAKTEDVVPYEHPLRVVACTKVLPPILLRHDGEYRIEIYAVKHPLTLLGSRRVVCRKI